MRTRSAKKPPVSSEAEAKALAAKRLAECIERAEKIRPQLLAAEKQLNSVFIQRKDAVRVMLVAHLIQQHYLLVGTPGTAKTALATSFIKHIKQATYFKTMLGSFSSPDKVFGPLDIKKFQAGIYEHVTDGMLADVDFGFLDEFFKANEATLNELLTALNEREFMGEAIPLMTCGMATNWPEVNMRTDNTNALYDRCLMRVVISDVSTQAATVKVLEAIDGVSKYKPTDGTTFTIDDLRDAQTAVKEVTISDTIRKLMADVRDKLAWRMVNGKKKPGIAISSRRLGALQDAMRASAWLDGRKEVGIHDFSILSFGLWNDRADHEHVKAVLDSLDQALVSALIGKIDHARTEYKQLSNSDFGTSKVTQVTDLIGEVVAEVKGVCAEPVFTQSGQLKIKKAMGKLVKDFQEMNKRELEFCGD